MFDRMNSKALRSTTNKNIARRIAEFMDPKNIVNNPRRISRGNYDFLEKLNRKFSMSENNNNDNNNNINNNESKDGIKEGLKEDQQQQQQQQQQS